MPGHSTLPHVLPATQLSSIRHGTTKGKIPYNVSLAECECRSTAMKTCTQNTAASATSPNPCKETGR